MSQVAMMPRHLSAPTNNRPLFVGLIIFALLATGLSLIFFALTPLRKTTINQTEFMTTNFDNSKSEFKNLEYTGPGISLPTKLPIATIKINPTLVNQIAQQIIEQYGLVQHPRSANLWVKDSYALLRDEKLGEYSFTKEDVSRFQIAATVAGELQPVQKTVQTETAINAADKFVQALLPQSNYRPLRSQLKYFHAESLHLDEANETDAQVIEISFAPEISNFPVINKYSEFAPIRVMMDSQNELVKMTIQAQVVETTIVKQVPTITTQQAISNILLGRGAIVAAYHNSADPLDLSIIYSGKLTKARVEYRTDLDTGLAYPVYRFKGTILNKQGEENTVDIITPAVEVAKSPNLQ